MYWANTEEKLLFSDPPRTPLLLFTFLKIHIHNDVTTVTSAA